MEKSTIKNLVLGSSAIALALFHVNEAMAAGTQPNIIIILVDDMGYGDLSCYGGTGYQTPNLDRLANQGIMLRVSIVAVP